MGLWHRFSCPKCGYQAEVSGGPDSGIDIFTTTVVCLDCRKLSDITIGKRDNPEPIPPRCRRSKRHAIEPWTDGDHCPRCATPMQNQGMTCIWD